MSQVAVMQHGAALTMSSREIAELTGKRHDHVLRDVENMLAELGETSPQIWGELPDSYDRMQRVAFLPKDLSVTLVAGYNVKMRHAIVKRWQELEAMQNPALPDLSTDEGKLLVIQEMAVKQLALIQSNKLLEAERDEAQRTKAYISDKKTATAMATASAKSREVARLKEELGRNQAHATVKVVEKMTRKSYDWRPLKKYCAEVGLDARNVVDEQYGTVKAWPAIAWRNVHGVDLEELFPVAGNE